MATRTEITEKGIRSEVWGEDSILDTLQHELLSLKDKLESARIREDYGTYKNLILAFKEVVHLINEEKEKTEWKENFSHYYDGKYMDEYIATWEQKGNDIRNHKIYSVSEEIINNGETVGKALKNIIEVYEKKDTKNIIESIIKRRISDNESFYDVLKSLSKEWNDFTEDNKRSISRTIVGIRNEDSFKALLDNLR
jgi:hypothetical protein